jgi:quinohemoprotein ethanol dehydrogenase
VWSANLGLGVAAPPITYAVNGRQYVAILVGWGGAGPAFLGSLVAKHGWAYKAQPRRLVAFALGGDLELPPSAPPTFPEPLVSSDFVVDTVLANAGGRSYAQLCTMCHSAGAVSGGVAPDLRASPVVLNRDAFLNVVLGGGLLQNGMPRFTSLTEIEAEGIQHYIRSQVPAPEGEE